MIGNAWVLVGLLIIGVLTRTPPAARGTRIGWGMVGGACVVVGALGTCWT
jgi:hypothetical protein